MIPDQFLQELKYRSDIEQIIGSYVNLRRRGRTLSGLCPFHSEKSPSFTVYPENQSFYCFGCGAGGDVISFIRRIENLDYMESIRFLAQRAGMQVPEEAGDDRSARLRKRILELNRDAARYFHRNLMSEAGRPGRAYLIGRGLTKATITHFGIGYASEGWNGLTDAMKSWATPKRSCWRPTWPMRASGAVIMIFSATGPSFPSSICGGMSSPLAVEIWEKRAPSTSTAAIPRYSKKAGTSLPSILPRAATARS